MPSTRPLAVYRYWSIALCASITVLGSTLSLAADRTLPDAQSTYRADRAACLRGQTNQDRDTCLREAGAALQEARRGGLTGGQEAFERNRVARCERQAPEDRELCVRRINGEGETSGSVADGGILRELVVPVPASN